MILKFIHVCEYKNRPKSSRNWLDFLTGLQQKTVRCPESHHKSVQSPKGILPVLQDREFNLNSSKRLKSQSKDQQKENTLHWMCFRKKTLKTCLQLWVFPSQQALLGICDTAFPSAIAHTEVVSQQN